MKIYYIGKRTKSRKIRRKNTGYNNIDILFEAWNNAKQIKANPNAYDADTLDVYDVIMAE